MSTAPAPAARRKRAAAAAPATAKAAKAATTAEATAAESIAADTAPTPDAAAAAAGIAARRLPPTRAAAARESQPDRRMNILLAAEKLFAQHGFHGVSIRDIASEAGVQLALVYYYFSSKNELYHAIFESWHGLIAGRVQRLQQAVAEPAAPDLLERIISAFIGPVIALHAQPEGRYYALMSARDLAAPTPEADRAHREFFDPMAHAFIDALQLVAPQATRGQVAWAYQFMLGALTHFLTDQRVERLSRGENRASDSAEQPRLLAFLAAGFRGSLGLALPQAAVKASPTRPSRPRPSP